MNKIAQRIGKYELQKEVGHGSFGEVWKCYDHQRHGEVALKVFHTDLQSDPNFLKRFVQEGQRLTHLRQRNIVSVREVNVTRAADTQATIAYIAMDYIEGTTLEDYIRNTSRVGRFPEIDDIVYIFTRIGKALDYAYEQGYVHGNIKPSNILVSREDAQEPFIGEPMLTDFGLTTVANKVDSPSISSAFYISPEQAKGMMPDIRSDIYALGVILYEICTGIQPFRSESSMAVMMQHINTLPTPPTLINPNVPAELSEVILRAMSKDPATRYASGTQLVVALANAVSTRIFLNNGSTTGKIPTPATNSGPLQTILGVSHPVPSAPSSQKMPAIPPSSPKITQIIPAMSLIGTGTKEPAESMALIPAQTTLISSPNKPRRRLSSTYLIIATVLVLLIITSVLGVLTFIRSQVAPPLVSGQIHFESDANGQNDILRMDMKALPAPAPGKGYDAWLLSQNNAAPILLGQLSVKQGVAQFIYPGTAQHEDLLVKASRILLTEENTNFTPLQPSDHVLSSLNLPQAPLSNDTQSLSLLDHLRHLLSNVSGTSPQDSRIDGGLSNLLFRNSSKTWLWASNSRDYWNGNVADTRTLAFIHSQLAHIIDIMQGKNIDSHDAQIARIGLIVQHPGSPVLNSLLAHLQTIAKAPQASAAQVALAGQIEQNLVRINQAMQRVNQDAGQLNAMDSQQLASQQAHGLLEEMALLANTLYNGQIDPVSNQLQQKGVAQIRADIQQLATFSFEPFSV